MSIFFSRSFAVTVAAISFVIFSLARAPRLSMMMLKSRELEKFNDIEKKKKRGKTFVITFSSICRRLSFLSLYGVFIFISKKMFIENECQTRRKKKKGKFIAILSISE